MKSATQTGRSANCQLIVPVPLSVLSAKIDAESAVVNRLSGVGGIVDPGSAALTSLVDTLWVSVRSVSVKVKVPEVGSSGDVSTPPGVDLPAANSINCGPVVITGRSLVPVIVIVNDCSVNSLAGAKLLSTLA